MKLSEAILEGSKVTTPAICTYSMDIPTGKVYCCALGAAFVGLKGIDPQIYNRYIDDITPEIEEATGTQLMSFITDPRTGEPQNMRDLIISLNDESHWSRERIAEYLAEQGL